MTPLKTRKYTQSRGPGTPDSPLPPPDSLQTLAYLFWHYLPSTCCFVDYCNKEAAMWSFSPEPFNKQYYYCTTAQQQRTGFQIFFVCVLADARAHNYAVCVQHLGHLVLCTKYEVKGILKLDDQNRREATYALTLRTQAHTSSRMHTHKK